MPYNEDDPRYKCCCNNCNAKTGATVILVLSISQLVPVVTTAVGGGTAGATGGAVFEAIIFFSCVASGFYAIYSEKAVFLIPFMILIVLWVVGFLVIGLGALGAGLSILGEDVLKDLLKKTQKDVTEGLEGMVTTTGIILAVVFFLLAGLCTWFFTVLLACYRMFKEKASYAPGIAMA